MNEEPMDESRQKEEEEQERERQEVGRFKVRVAYDRESDRLACWAETGNGPGCGCITCPTSPWPICDCPPSCPDGTFLNLDEAKVMSVTFDIADAGGDFLIAVDAEPGERGESDPVTPQE